MGYKSRSLYKSGLKACLSTCQCVQCRKKREQEEPEGKNKKKEQEGKNHD